MTKGADFMGDPKNCGKAKACLSGTDPTCPPDEVEKCRQIVGGEASASSGGCQQPDKLSGEPGDCSPDQIRDCHGDADSHPCDCGG
jgi:hypothetical protein